MKNIIYFFFIIFFSVSCSVGTKSIDYGNDKCEHCKMIISDKRYGTEIVTKKGKVFTFDSVECLLHYLNTKTLKESDLFGVFVTDFSKPNGELHDAKNCFYLLSENLPSPMGENITAFSNKNIANEFYQKHSGYVLDWNKLREIVNR